MSAGHLPATSSHTIHYRPDNFDISPVPTGHPGHQFNNYTTVLGPATNGEISQHSSYRNTPIPPVQQLHHGAGARHQRGDLTTLQLQEYSHTTSSTTTPRCWGPPPTGRSHNTPATGILPYHQFNNYTTVLGPATNGEISQHS